jgi:colanic acid biosynthesis glycosyl transferase WcaI
MHLRFFNRCYWPDSQATGQLLTELCEFLAQQHEVQALVGQPFFPEADTEFETEGSEKRNGVTILRLPHLHLHRAKYMARIRCMLSFTRSVRTYLKRESKRPQNRDQSVWVCETDPFLLPLVVGPEARRRKIPVVYYIQDIYPDIAVALGVVKNHLPIRMLRSKLKREYRQADMLIVLDEDMKDRLAGWGIPPDKIEIVPNWMDCNAVQPIKQNNPFRHELGIDDRFIVMHSGNMGLTQRLEDLIDATRTLGQSSNIELLMIGGGAKMSELKRHAKGTPYIRFLPYQPRERLGESLSAADLHIVSMDPAITGCLAPSKLYGILASGTPVLAIVPKGNAVWRFVESHQIGWCAEPQNLQSIAASIRVAAQTPREILLQMGMRGRSLAEQLFDKQLCCSQFEQLLSGFVEQRITAKDENDLSFVARRLSDAV